MVWEATIYSWVIDSDLQPGRLIKVGQQNAQLTLTVGELTQFSTLLLTVCCVMCRCRNDDTESTDTESTDG